MGKKAATFQIVDRIMFMAVVLMQACLQKQQIGGCTCAQPNIYIYVCRPFLFTLTASLLILFTVVHSPTLSSFPHESF